MYGQQDFVRKVPSNATFSIPGLEYALSRSLREAASRGYHEILRLLLAHGAYAEDDNFWAPFGAASRGGYDRVVRLLLKHRPDTSGWPNLLSPAACKGQTHIVSLLLESQADLNLERCSDQAVRAFKVAKREGYESVVREFGHHRISLESLEESLDRLSLRRSWVSSIGRDSQ